MTERSEPEKKRLEEARKWQAETERSLAVVKAKEAHKLIEDTEKARKRSAVFSICERLFAHAKLTIGYAHYLLGLKSIDKDYELKSPERKYIEDLMKTYESIRYDFLKTLEIRDEDMEKLFPKINMDFGEFFVNHSKLKSMIDQMIDMVIYCKRLWR